jgi:8-oxo-dGTP pyrophosphatase MutT (NUDIX family)
LSTPPGTDLIVKARALLVTDDGRLLLIRREREAEPTWWVLPGGGIEPSDASLEDAVRREVLEETGAGMDIHALVLVVVTNCAQAIFLGRSHGAHPARRGGPELTDGSGEYHLEEVPLDPDLLAGLDLWPPPAREWLVGLLRNGTDLFRVPDVRAAGPLVWAPEPAGQEAAA